jgi:peptidoglycan hydrolase-like protein with peptidoglycan-binding domain
MSDTFIPPALDNAVAFIDWAKSSQVPFRDGSGQLIVWNPDSAEFEEIEAFGRESFYLGEIGELNVSLRQHILVCEQRLTANSVSSLTVQVYDPEFRMYKNGYFDLERTMNYNGYFYRLTNVSMKYREGRQIVQLQGRSYNAYKLMEDRGNQTWTGISPTEFAQIKAAEAGLEFFGEVTAVGDPIQRVQKDNTDESTWDVLSKLAKENEFSLFEANNKLFFATDKTIIANQNPEIIRIPATTDDTLVLLDADFKRSVDDKYSGGVSVRFHKTAVATRLTPGMAVRIIGMGDFDEIDLMVENVQVDIKPQSQVRVSCRSTENLGGCALQTFQLGDRGECVKRIQRAVREFTSTVRPQRQQTQTTQTDLGDGPALSISAGGLTLSVPVTSTPATRTPKETVLLQATSGYGSGNTVAPNTKATGEAVGTPNSISPVLSQADQEATLAAVEAGLIPASAASAYIHGVPYDSAWDSAKQETTPLPARTVNRLLAIDGIYGRNTETAVKQFQTKVGLPSTGIVDRATWEAIERKT